MYCLILINEHTQFHDNLYKRQTFIHYSAKIPHPVSKYGHWRSTTSSDNFDKISTFKIRREILKLTKFMLHEIMLNETNTRNNVT